MKTLLLALALLCSRLAFGQSAELDLQKALSVFTESPYLFYEATLYYFDGHTTQPADSLACVYQRHGQQLYAQFGSVEILNTGTIMLVADHESKAISINQLNKDQQLPYQVFNEKMFLGMMHDRGAKVEHISAPDGYKAIQVVSTDESGTHRAIFRYHADTWLLQEVQITSTSGLFDPLAERLGNSTVWVRYQVVDTVPRHFSHKPGQFVTKGKEGYRGSGKCVGYQIY